MKCFRLFRKTKIDYPSSILLQPACYEDFKLEIDIYMKSYEKVNIAFGFCGIILIPILRCLDFSFFHSSATWLIQLLLLLRSQYVYVFDSTAIRNENIYRLREDQAALWLIGKYTDTISHLHNLIQDTNTRLNSAIVKITIALILHAISLIIMEV